MDPDEFARTFGVSRETTRRLERYLELLARWNRRINLVAKSGLADAWPRHLADSAQLFCLAPVGARSWVDLGSGGGLPGLVVAVLAAERAPQLRVTLIETDRRKAAFLATAAREVDVAVTIEPRRIESLAPRPYDVVSARALAPLGRLCSLAHRFKGPGTVFLFPKGAGLDSELTVAARHWHIHADRIDSRTHPDAAILRIMELEPRT